MLHIEINNDAKLSLQNKLFYIYANYLNIFFFWREIPNLIIVDSSVPS